MKIQIGKKLALNSVEVSKEVKAKEVSKPTNHVLVIDCSGSMSWVLPQIQNQLKNKLPNLVKENDTVSLIWFSGKNQCGLIAEKIKVKDLNDLQRLNTAIDRWLKPIGLTGFVEPLENVIKIATGGEVYSLFFMTDGYDNQWSRNEILNMTSRLKDTISSAVFVEYGWNCNRALMAEMASEVGGSLVFCEDFDAYDPVISSTLSKSFKSSKKKEIKVDKPLYDLVFSVDDTGPCTYKVENGKVLVPESVKEIYFYNESAGGEDIKDIDDKDALVPVYQSLVVLSQRMKSTTIREILAGLGDVQLWNKYANCFGKQNTTDFQQLVLESCDPKAMFEEGREYGLKVDEDAFTILDLLFQISNDEGNYFVPSKMNYKKIGKTLENADGDETLKFNYKDNDKGYPVSALTWNESRPNVSVLVKMDGTVTLPPNEFTKKGLLPKDFPTFIFRNYTIIRDGIANIDELPLRLSKVTFLALKSLGLVSGSWDEDKVYMINLRSLPTINQRMIKNVSAKSLFLAEYDLLKLKASQKVYKAFREKWCGKPESEGFKVKYGEEIALWLNDKGISDGGFAPKKVSGESTDFYMGIELTTSLKGISSIPSFNDLVKKMTSGKALTPREKLLKPAYDECIAIEKKLGTAKDDLQEWISKKAKEAIAQTRAAMRKIAELKFAVVVGQVWFDEFASINENALVMDLDGEKIECTVNLKDIEVKI